MGKQSFIFLFIFLVHGVFGAGEVSVSLMVGDNVTLLTDDSETQGAEKFMWRIQGENKFIAIIDRETSETTVPGNDEERFGGRLGVNSTTGSLTITNLKTTDSKVYELQIKIGRETKSKIFNVDVRDEMKTVSVKEGEPVTLDTGLIKIKGYDLILWTFENHLIARINRATNQFSLSSAGGKFEGRLQRDLQTGSLIIRNSRTTDSGDYHLKMSNSTHTLQKTITVTVTNVPVTNVPVTNVPVTNVPVTNVPVTNVPVTNVPVRDVPVTEGSGWKTAFIIVVVVVSLVIIGFLIMISYKKRICWKKGADGGTD